MPCTWQTQVPYALQEDIVKKWNQTTITWPMWDYHVSGNAEPKGGKPTNIPCIPCDDSKDADVIHCTQIVAESKFDRSFELRIHLWLKKYNGKPSYLSWREALKLLEPLVRVGVIIWDFFESGDADIRITVPLTSGEHFTERSILLVGEVFSLLGIDDHERKLRGNFSITQTTYILSGEKRILYVDWLREKFGLKEPYIYS